MAHSPANTRILRLIAVFKLFKGLVLFALGVGALRLLHRDLAVEVIRWANVFRVDPGNRHLVRLLARVSSLDETKLRALSVGTFFYSALLLTEGTGLLMGKVWAEYFTIFMTSSFIPLEVYELVRRVTFPKVSVLLINIAIVVYLVFELRQDRERSLVLDRKST